MGRGLKLGKALAGHATAQNIGCYQARHRLLTGRIAVPLAAGLILLAAGIYLLMVISWPLPSGLDFKGALFPILIGSALAVPYVFYVILLAGRVAFRADQAGITLPPHALRDVVAVDLQMPLQVRVHPLVKG